VLPDHQSELAAIAIHPDSVLRGGVDGGDCPILEGPANRLGRREPRFRPGSPSDFQRERALPTLVDARSRNQGVFPDFQHEHLTIGEGHSNGTPSQRDGEGLRNLPDEFLGRGGWGHRSKRQRGSTVGAERRALGNRGVTGRTDRRHGRAKLREVKKNPIRSESIIPESTLGADLGKVS